MTTLAVTNARAVVAKNNKILRDLILPILLLQTTPSIFVISEETARALQRETGYSLDKFDQRADLPKDLCTFIGSTTVVRSDYLSPFNQSPN